MCVHSLRHTPYSLTWLPGTLSQITGPSKSHVQGPCPFQLGILRMPPPRQGWPHSAISNNSNKSSSHCAPLHTSHLSAPALSLGSFTKPLGGFRFPSLRSEEAEGGQGKRESLRSPGRAALSPRSLSLSLCLSLSQPWGLSAVWRFGAKWGAGEAQGSGTHG